MELIQHKNSIIKTGIMSVLIFFILYNISFKFNESLTTGRISLLILAGWSLFIGRVPLFLFNTKLWLMLLPLPYVALQYLIVGDFGQLSRFIHLVLFSYVGAALIVGIVNDIKIIYISTIIAIVVQAIILIFSFYSSEYRMWFGTIAASEANYDAFYIYRAPGFAGAGGASLSVIQSLGVLLGWLMLRKNAFYAPVDGIFKYAIIFAMLLSFISCIVVGRTGMILSIGFGLMFLFSMKFQLKFIISLIFLPLCLYFLFENTIISFLDDDFSVDYFGNWAFGFFAGDDDTVEGLTKMSIPPLSVEMLHGTGLITLIDGLNPSGNDSGFIQAYYSMGLPMALIFYTGYLYLLFYIFRWFPLVIKIIFVGMFLMIEAKEPFIFKYSTLFVLMMINLSHVAIVNSLKYLNK